MRTDRPTDRPTDQPTDRPTDQRTKRGVESHSTRLKTSINKETMPIFSKNRIESVSDAIGAIETWNLLGVQIFYVIGCL